MDLGFIRRERSPEGLVYRQLRHEPLLAMMPSDHPLRAEREIAPRLLSGSGFIGISGTAPVLRPIVLDTLDSSGTEVRMASEADYLSMAISLIASTRSVALLPVYAVGLLPWSVISRPLKGTVPTVDLVLAHHRAETRPVVRHVVAHADTMAQRVERRLRARLAAQAA